MIKKQGKEVIALYKGSTPILKVYKGTKLVFPTTVTPSGLGEHLMLSDSSKNLSIISMEDYNLNDYPSATYTPIAVQFSDDTYILIGSINSEGVFAIKNAASMTASMWSHNSLINNDWSNKGYTLVTDLTDTNGLTNTDAIIATYKDRSGFTNSAKWSERIYLARAKYPTLDIWGVSYGEMQEVKNNKTKLGTIFDSLRAINSDIYWRSNNFLVNDTFLTSTQNNANYVYRSNGTTTEKYVNAYRLIIFLKIKS